MSNIHCPQCHMEFPEEGNDRCPGCGRPVDAAGPSAGEERPEGGIKAPVAKLEPEPEGDVVSIPDDPHDAYAAGVAAGAARALMEADKAALEASGHDTSGTVHDAPAGGPDASLEEQAAAGDVDAQAALAEQEGGRQPDTTLSDVLGDALDEQGPGLTIGGGDGPDTPAETEQEAAEATDPPPAA